MSEFYENRYWLYKHDCQIQDNILGHDPSRIKKAKLMSAESR